VVIAIVGFVLYRLRQFRRESAQAAVSGEPASGEPSGAAPPAPPKRPGRHRSDAEV
jgi:hypothetical protein